MTNSSYADDPVWMQFEAHVLKTLVPMLTDCAASISLVPAPDKVDVKFAVELGLSVMMDKPIVAVAQPGVEIPSKLRAVADAVIVADVTTDEGRQALAEGIITTMSLLGLES
jgi:hypothetical protein